MGIRGLTTFISHSSDKFFERHQLHNSYLVLDANNICCQLYIWHTKALDCFGGDYDTFARVVEAFFASLKKCNITPIVVFDGNYERKKLKTIFTRYRDRIKSAGRLSPAVEGSCKVFPLFTRVMFAEVVARLGLYVYRCELEADNELACLARALNCPILSYDSDFYIFDVLFIPFNSLSFNPKFNKLKKTWYLDCDLYKTENLLKAFPGLRREHLPLIATLLGNDYIKSSVFHSFYSQLKLKRGTSSANLQQRKIGTVIQWLRTETFESAVCKILNRIKMCERKKIAKQIDIIVKGYICCDSVVLKDLKIKYHPVQTNKLNLKYDIDHLIDSCDKVGNLQPESEESEDLEEQEMSATLDISLDIEVVEISSYKSIPDWFVMKHKLCEYPSVIYEIAQGLFFFCTPQAEDYTNKPSHSICFKIIAAINKLVTQTICEDKERPLQIVGRNDSNGVVKFKLPLFEGELISLQEIPTLATDKRLDVMLNILDLSMYKSHLNEIPNDWRLLVLSMIFWIKNATVPIKESHTFSVYLSVIVLKIIDKQIGPIRNLTKLRTKCSKLLETKNDEANCLGGNLQETLAKISESESASAMSSLIPSFHLSEKIARNHKLFDIRIVDALAQFQCCIFYITALNSLLDAPLEKLVISDFYNGTLMYNLCGNFSKRTDVVGYLKQLLNNSPNIVNACVKLEEFFNAIVRVKQDNTSRKKRVRKGNKSKNAMEVEIQQIVDKINGNTFIDENNAYSILNIAE